MSVSSFALHLVAESRSN